MIESGNKRDALEVLDKNSKSLSIMDSENAEKKWKNLTSK
jgi:hypothetical protein